MTLPGRELDRFALAVPGWALATEAARNATVAAACEAAHVVGMTCIALVSDALAAAAALVATHPPVEPRTVLVVDVGHASSAATVVEVSPGGKISVRGTATDTAVSGSAFDARLFTHALDRFCALHGKTGSTVGNTRSRARLAAAVERAKTVLSTIPETVIEADCFDNDVDLRVPVTRTALADICNAELVKLESLVGRALDAAGIADSASLAACEIVGGGMRSPTLQAAVQHALTSRGGWAADKAFSRSLDSACSIATGAALVAQFVAGSPNVGFVAADGIEPNHLVRCTAELQMPPEMPQWLAQEAEFAAQDEARAKRAAARHVLESFVIEMRSKVSSSDEAVKKALPDADRAKLTEALIEADNWVTDNAETATLETLTERLAEIKKRVTEAAPELDKLLEAQREERKKLAEAAAHAPAPHTDGSTAAKRQSAEPQTTA